MSQMIIGNQKPRYTSAADQVNLAGYDCLLPEIYAPVSEYDAHFGTVPLYEYNQNTQGDLSRGVATIAHMIEMNANRYKFIILNDEDTLEIIDVLERLFTELELSISHDPTLKRFKELAFYLYQNLKDERRRIFRRRGMPDPEESTLRTLLTKLLPT